jgi:hypothetical protein
MIDWSTWARKDAGKFYSINKAFRSAVCGESARAWNRWLLRFQDRPNERARSPASAPMLAGTGRNIASSSFSSDVQLRDVPLAVDVHDQYLAAPEIIGADR